MTLTDQPIELDEHRGMAAQKSTELRRRLHEVQADQEALRRRQEEFDALRADAAPFDDLARGCGKGAISVSQLFAATPEARDGRRQELIATVLQDLARLSD